MARRFCLFASVVSCFLFQQALADVVQYHVEIDNTWSTTTHPGAFPHEAHFSWFGGGVHNDNVSFWEVGRPTSPGMTLMAETGVTTDLLEEVESAIEQGNAMVGYDIHHWFCPAETNVRSCGDPNILIRASTDNSLVTLVSMLGPSPDWFVGTSGLDLRKEGKWQEEIMIDLHPYDGGTRSNNAWTLFGPMDNPAKPVSVITEESGQLVGPGSLGTMTFRLVHRGDLNADGAADDQDIDTLSTQIRAGDNDPLFDLNGDRVVDGADRKTWVKNLKSTWFGDSDLDGEFNSGDLVAVFAAGEYEDAIEDNSGWAEGDWDADGDFTSGDLVAAFQDGGYEQGPRPEMNMNAVPEPTSTLMLIAGMVGIAIRRRYTDQT